MAAVTVGVDVGGTKVAAAAVDGIRVLERVERPTALSTTEALVDQIEELARAALAHAPPAAAVGIGVPSQVDFATGKVVASVNIPLAGVPLREELGARLGVPVFVDNDGNCAALAELHMLGRAWVGNLVMLTLGTGVGGGVVVDGEIFRGSSGRGAELGHLVVQADGPECPGACPNRGCIEAYSSGLALERDATEAGRRNPRSALGRVVAEHGRCKGRQAVEAARAGDAEALRLFERLGTYLGVGMASLMNIFEPEYLLIGGGLGEAADLFLERAEEEALSRALPSIAGRVRVARARGGAAAGVIGAGLLAAGEHERGSGTRPQMTVKEGAL
ncbi:MAG: ROK family protein [Thermoleophilaceae bacterium]|nr:ROK family protein [Thermoleophilaceae bacterium]